MMKQVEQVHAVVTCRELATISPSTISGIRFQSAGAAPETKGLERNVWNETLTSFLAQRIKINN